MRVVQPQDWPRPHGYACGIAAEGTLVFVSGQVGWNAAGEFAPDFVGQVRLALENVAAVLAEAGGAPHHIARLTWYVTDKAEYVANRGAIGEAYRAVLGRHFPAMSVVEVAALVEDLAKVEIEATAVLPQSPPPQNGRTHADD